MAVKIRLQRKGKKRKPFYHIVIADARSPRDGRFIEKIGTYNPMTVPATIELDRDKAFQWIGNGAQPTDTVRAILRFKGIGYRKHLQRGVKKGALTQEKADELYQAWIDAKEAKIAKRREKALADKAAWNAKIAGLDLPFPVKEKEVPKVEVKDDADETPAADSEEKATEEGTTADADASAESETKEEAKGEEE
ncbi:MAG: 30S ribosomal protein S16 [Bacteroidota bacterium]